MSASDPMFLEEDKLSDLFSKAAVEVLSLEECREVHSIMDEFEELPKVSTPRSDKFTKILDKNPEIALEIVLKHRIEQPPEILDSMLKSLLTSVLSADTIAAVIKLSAKNVLPREFIDDFVLKSVKFCGEIDVDCVEMQLVRLTCALVQTLLRKYSKSMLHLKPALEEFCDRFQEIKEVYQLLRTLRITFKKTEDKDSIKPQEKTNT